MQKKHKISRDNSDNSDSKILGYILRKYQNASEGKVRMPSA